QLSVSAHSRLFIMSGQDVLLAHPNQRLAVVPGRRAMGELMTVRDVNDPLIEAFAEQLRPEDRVAPPGGERGRQFSFRHEGVGYFARATAFSIDGEQAWIVGALAP